MNKVIWTTKQGKEIPIEEMVDSHLVNALRKIHYGDSEYTIGQYETLFFQLQEEAANRGIDWLGDGKRSDPSDFKVNLP